MDELQVKIAIFIHLDILFKDLDTFFTQMDPQICQIDVFFAQLDLFLAQLDLFGFGFGGHLGSQRDFSTLLEFMLIKINNI